MTQLWCVFQYQLPYDEERDWPQVEREDEVDYAGDQAEGQQPLLRMANRVSPKICA